MNFLPIEALAKFFRAKSFYKWSHSNGIAGNLIRNELSRSKKDLKLNKTWCSKTHKFIKKHNFSLGLTNRKIKEKVKQIFEGKKSFNPPNNLNTLSIETKLGNGKCLQEYALQEGTHPACRLIEKMRTGTFLTSADLRRSDKLKDELFNKCISCKEEFKDNIEHVIFECNGFLHERNTLLKDLITIFKTFFPNHWRKKLLSFILFGKEKINLNKALRIKMESLRGKFMSSVNELRQKHIISALKGL